MSAQSRLLLTAAVFTITLAELVQAATLHSRPNTLSDTNESIGSTRYPTPIVSQEKANSAIAQLRSRGLLMPVAGVNPSMLKGSFYEMRGNDMHQAVDILAPRNTPVRAVSDGTADRLFLSRLGGNTIYEIDPSRQYVFYYAHLEHYADNLKEGQPIKRGEIIGYVGTSGDAPPNCPHLHFSIGILGKEKRWWVSSPIDPYEVFKK